MRPLGLRRRNQSFFCSLVKMLMRVVVQVTGLEEDEDRRANSSRAIWTFWPLGVFCVMRWRPCDGRSVIRWG